MKIKPNEYQNSLRYRRTKTDQIALTVPKGMREKYKALAESQGKSLNQLINELLSTALQESEND